MNGIHYKTVLICIMVCMLLSADSFAYTGKDRKKSPAGTSVITIRVKEGQSIRDISGKHLRDPDLWEDILRANHLKTPDQIRPGMILYIPVKAITRANDELENSKQLIHQATKAGARIFAPKIITKAIQLRNNALEKRKLGEWPACTAQAKLAADKAGKALEKSVANQDVPAEAMVDYRQGQVHKRKPSDNLWKEVSQYDILLEGEKIRTLSQSQADIVFRDESRLQLKANAQALIRKMRSNLLEDVGEAKIKLIKGDVLALLSGGKEDNQFQLEVEGVETRIRSRRFRAGHDKEEQVSWFAVDEGEVEISAKGKKVILKKNQGSVVPLNQKPSEPQELLPAPELLDPPDGDERFDLSTALVWERVKGAGTYLLELSDNASFSRIIWSEKIRDAADASPGSVRGMFPEHIGPGAFYWRVIPISPERLPGRVSKARFLRIIDDKEPPFLVIQFPQEGETFSESTIEISGSTEEDATLLIQDQPVKVGKDGKYQFRHELSAEGKNSIVVSATDRAGNVSHLKRTVLCLPASEIDLSFDPLMRQIRRNHFLVRHENFTLSGRTDPDSLVTVRKSGDSSPDMKSSAPFIRNFSATTTADNIGQFQMNVRATEPQNTYAIEIISLAGKTRKDRFFVEIDNNPPIIRFNEEIPPATAQKQLPISGTLEGGVSLYLNGQEVSLEASNIQHPASSFQFPFKLNPGINPLRFTARDLVGNISVIEKQVFFDPDAPRLVKYKFSPKRTKGAEQATLSVQATDATMLRKTARFIAQVGEFRYAGYMTRSDAKGEYIGLFYIPQNVKGAIKLKDVTLSDYLGNTKTFDIRR